MTTPALLQLHECAHMGAFCFMECILVKAASGPVSFWLYSRKEFVKAFGEDYVPPKGMNQSFELAFWLPTYADVDAEYERLSKMEIPFPSGEPMTYSFGIRNFYVADPEGNLIEIGSMNKNI